MIKGNISVRHMLVVFFACLLTAGTAVAVGGVKAVNAENPGEEIELANYLVGGKINIVDFYSEYCPPCRRIAPYLEELDKKSEDKVVVKVDINRPDISGIDWGSPLARQFNLNSIPHFKIFDGEGNKTAEGREAFNILMKYFNEKGIRIR
jgi:thiol-disulfide isomerase/thioredoxin